MCPAGRSCPPSIAAAAPQHRRGGAGTGLARGGGGARPVVGRAAGRCWALGVGRPVRGPGPIPEVGGRGEPPQSGREGRPVEAPEAGGGRGAAAAAPGPARHPQGSERPGGSGGSSGKFWERRSGQRLPLGPRGGTGGGESRT